jgi:hypothetical protein
VVSVLATGPKGRRFKLGRGEGFLRAIEIRSTPSFGREVKPKELVGLPESPGGQVRSYPQPESLSPWLSTLTYHPRDEQ